ncbi:MAG: choice-of-anchor D domain-containing protein [Akkermansiaceae bacterium]
MTLPRLTPLLAVALLHGVFLMLGSAPGGAQMIAIEGNGVLISAGDPTPSLSDHTDFGGVYVAAGVIDRVFTIKNSGVAPLVMLGFQRLGTHAGEFTVLPIPGQFPQIQQIAGGGQLDLTVRFNPRDDGARFASLRFVSNASDHPVYEFSITGEGLDPAPEINVQGNGIDIPDGSPVPNLNNHTDFESTDTDTGFVTRTFTIQNSGLLSLNVFEIQIIGETSDQFSVTSPASDPVSAESSTSFDVTFNPDRVGGHLATVRIVNSDLTEGTYDFIIRGTATTTSARLSLLGNNLQIAAGDDTPSPDDHTEFESTDLGATSFRTFSILNTGNAPLSIATIELVGGQAASFSSSLPSSNPIAPGNQATIQISLQPSVLALHQTILRINSSDRVTPIYDVTLSGTGGIFKLVSIKRDGDDALITFHANPTSGSYLYQILHSTDMENWSTKGSLFSSGGETRDYRHRDGFLGKNGFWHVSEQTL